MEYLNECELIIKNLKNLTDKKINTNNYAAKYSRNSLLSLLGDRNKKKSIKLRAVGDQNMGNIQSEGRKNKIPIVYEDTGKKIEF